MDYTLMVVASSKEGITSQLKSFETKNLAEVVANSILKHQTNYWYEDLKVQVIRLYDKDTM